MQSRLLGRYHYELVVHWMVDNGLVQYVSMYLPGSLWQCQQVAHPVQLQFFTYGTDGYR